MITPRSICIAALAVLLGSGSLYAQSAPDAGTYVPPAGTAPPVAPQLIKGSPLDHLANDPKLDSLPVGFKQGDTSGTTYWIAHRFIDPVGGEGWGWVKPGNAKGWHSAKWIALLETPGVVVAPHRKLTKAEGDVDWEFKFWGTFATFKAYDPRLDEMLPVFILKGYEVIGPEAPVDDAHIGAPGRPQLERGSSASSRPSSPILTNPGVD